MEKLEYFLDNVPVPVIINKPKTFLGIAKQPHYENVLSNMYAFFFDENEVHGFKNLFITSLVEIIKESGLEEKGISFERFSDFNCETEFPTKKGGRIDLLIKNNEQAILIENKIYHSLNNDLKDYWSTIKLTDEKKIGVVLSLHHIPIIAHHGFINITHLSLMKKIMSNVGHYLLNSDPTYLVFLKDFYQNIINMSTKSFDKKDIEFYREYRDEIHHVTHFLGRFQKHVQNQVEFACDILNGDAPFLQLGGKGGTKVRYYTSLKNSNLLFTIDFGNLFSDDGRSILIIVELNGEILKDRSVLRQVQLTDEEEMRLNQNFYYEQITGWAHFAINRYSLENIDFENLSQFIAEKIREDHLLSIFKKLELFLSELKIVK